MPVCLRVSARYAHQLCFLFYLHCTSLYMLKLSLFDVRPIKTMWFCFFLTNVGRPEKLNKHSVRVYVPRRSNKNQSHTPKANNTNNTTRKPTLCVLNWSNVHTKPKCFLYFPWLCSVNVCVHMRVHLEHRNLYARSLCIGVCVCARCR